MGLNNNNITSFYYSTCHQKKVNKHYRQKNNSYMWNIDGKYKNTGRRVNELLYGVIKLSPLMKLKIIER